MVSSIGSDHIANRICIAPIYPAGFMAASIVVNDVSKSSSARAITITPTRIAAITAYSIALAPFSSFLKLRSLLVILFNMIHSP